MMKVACFPLKVGKNQGKLGIPPDLLRGKTLLRDNLWCQPRSRTLLPPCTARGRGAGHARQHLSRGRCRRSHQRFPKEAKGHRQPPKVGHGSALTLSIAHTRQCHWAPSTEERRNCGRPCWLFSWDGDSRQLRAGAGPHIAAHSFGGNPVFSQETGCKAMGQLAAALLARLHRVSLDPLCLLQPPAPNKSPPPTSQPLESGRETFSQPTSSFSNRYLQSSSHPLVRTCWALADVHVLVALGLGGGRGSAALLLGNRFPSQKNPSPKPRVIYNSVEKPQATPCQGCWGGQSFVEGIFGMMGVGARKRGLLRWGVVPWLHTRVKGGQRRPDPVPELPPQEPRQSPCSSPRPPPAAAWQPSGALL